ncbi:MAG TPA: hypothetical protein PLH20_15550, partial [Flavobacterium sp.]|nr:hypothetical protein [Flavobacterium sp.]
AGASCGRAASTATIPFFTAGFSFRSGLKKKSVLEKNSDTDFKFIFCVQTGRDLSLLVITKPF